MITECEASHAMELLREVSNVGWSGRRAIVPVDPVCNWRMWEPGNTRCGEPLYAAIVFEDTEAAHVLVLCEHHAKVMEAAITRWREIA